MRRLQRTVTTIVSVGLLSAGLVAVAAAPVAANPDTPLSANRSSMWQTNGDVDSLAVGNGILYAGGRFGRVRPPGAAAGTSETTRTYLAAFNASTGALNTTFNVTLNGRVRAVRLASDGSRLYIGGDFTTVNGVARSRLAAVNPTTGALDTTFVANANAVVSSIAPSSSAIFVGGDFTTIKGVARVRLASLNPVNGNVSTTFNASLDGRPRASAVAPDGSRLLVGGPFQTVNGITQPAIASLSPTTGAMQPWAATGIVPRALAGGGCDSEVSDLVMVGSNAYVVAEGLQPGCFEGEYSANIADGTPLWTAQCLGASQATAVIGSFVYRGSHMHDCGRTPGGFVGPRTSADFVWYRLAAHSLSDGTFAHWSPNTNGAGTDHVGPHAMATDGTQLFVGGDFSTVGGAAQQGLTRFAPTGGNSTPGTPLAPTVTASAAGTVTVVARGVADNNNGMLTYRLFRDGGTTPVASTVVESWPWSLPEIRFDDAGLPAGSTHTYRISASDGTATSALSAVSASVTVSAANPPAYAPRVQAANPGTYWQLDEANGPVVGSSVSGAEGIIVGGVTRNQPAAIAGGAAVTLDGTSGYLAAATPTTHTDSYTQTAFFKTTTRVGGAIMGYSSDQTGAGPATGSDRVVFMENDGKLAFVQRVVPVGRGASFAFVRSATTFRDGRWHQVTATYGAGVMNLYVDGALQGTTAVVGAALPAPGYLRAGYTDLSSFYLVFGRNYSNIPAPTSYFFSGDLDEVADFPSELSPSQVAALWTSGAAGLLGAAPADTLAPSTPGNLAASKTATSVTLTWTASTDNVAVTGYQVRRDGTLITTTAPGVLTYTDNGRTPNTLYAYTVTAIDAVPNASTPAAVNVTTDSVSSALFTDAWTGANGAAWSPSWTTTVNAGTVDTQNSAGRLAFNDTASAWARAQLTGSTAVADADLVFSYQWSSGQPRAYFSAYLRGTGGWGNSYRPLNGYGLQIQSDSAAVLVQKNVNGTVSTVSSLTGAQQVGTGKQWVRFRIVGQTLYVRTWTDGTPEPASWTYTTTDTSLATAGQVFLSINRSGSNVGSKEIRLDDLALSAATGP